MNLSKSKYCNGIQCPKMLWLYKNMPDKIEEIDNDSIMDNGNLVHDIARDLLGNHTNIEYNKNLNEMINDTKELLKNDSIVITEASFNYNNNFCSVDILKKDGSNYEMYEVKGSTHLKDIFIDDISYQKYVLTKLGLNVNKCFVVHINSNYVRKGNLELDKLFIKNDVTDIVNSKQKEVEDNINKLNNYMMQDKEPKDDISINCFAPYKCPFFKYCTRLLPENNIFNIPRMLKKEKFKYYYQGIYSYEDLLDTEINDKYKQVIEYELDDKEDLILKDKIKEFLNTLTYPLYFLDFETFQMPIPKYDNISPYEQVPFQYSLHYYEKEGSNLEHKEFLSEVGIDPRRSLAESLVKDIPLNVCTLAYNMGFEKGVIRKLAELYPDLSNHLMNIHDNIKDLMIPFQKGYYYTKNMHGLYTIKYVLPALFPNDPELDYHNLEEIHNGSEAMNAFYNLENLSIKEQEKVRNNLLKYCYLDTYAMVKIYEKLKSML